MLRDERIRIPAWPHFEECTRPFRLLYDHVTEELKAYAASLPDEREVAWFNELIDGFQREYELWSTSARVRRYLNAVQRHCKPAPLWVICFAYLHVVYDLPRVIARTLRTTPLPRQRTREVYAKAGPLLLSVFDRCHTDSSIWGWYAALLRIVPARFSASRVLAYWILAHRAASWIKAETLAEVDDSDQEELDLWVRIESAALPLIERRAGVTGLLGWLSTADTLGTTLYQQAGSTPKPNLDKEAPEARSVVESVTGVGEAVEPGPDVASDTHN